MEDVKGLIRPWFNKIRYPRLGGAYCVLTREGIYSAPSIRQASILGRYVKANWSLPEHDMVKKLIAADPVKQTPIISDIVSNIGYSAIAYSKILAAHGGRCISFEPIALNCLAYLKNVRRFPGISLVSIALSDGPDVLTFGMPSYVKKDGL